MKIYNFNLYKENNLLYGGNAGTKDGIIIDNENWIVKFPQATRNLHGNIDMPYAQSSLSEYLGSEIYRLIGIETHEVALGCRDGKLVVVCKDFKGTNEYLFEYNQIKNKHLYSIDKALQQATISTPSSTNIDLDELISVMEVNPYFQKIKNLKNHFWDMFVVDTFIKNPDRNNGNWELVLNTNTNKFRIAPVYDNGASLFSKIDDKKIYRILNSDGNLEDKIINDSISIFKRNEHRVNPIACLKSCSIPDLNRAVLRIISQIDLVKNKKFNK